MIPFLGKAQIDKFQKQQRLVQMKPYLKLFFRFQDNLH